MERPNALLKVMALISSVLLLGAFVSFRAGAFNWLTRPGGRPIDSDECVTSDESQSDDSLLSGSKSGYLPPSERSGPHAQRPRTSAPSAQEDSTLLPGSKSFSPMSFLKGYNSSPAFWELQSDLNIAIVPTVRPVVVDPPVSPPNSSR
jgi:hypothetical protein